MIYKRLVKGTNSLMDGQEAAFGPLLDFYKVDVNLKTHYGKFRQLLVATEENSKSEVKGLYIEDGYLINLSEDENNVFQHGKFIREYSYKTTKTKLTINEFENTLQVSLDFGTNGIAQYKRNIYLPLIQQYFSNFQEGNEDKLIKNLDLLV